MDFKISEKRKSTVKFKEIIEEEIVNFYDYFHLEKNRNF